MKAMLHNDAYESSKIAYVVKEIENEVNAVDSHLFSMHVFLASAIVTTVLAVAIKLAAIFLA